MNRRNFIALAGAVPLLLSKEPQRDEWLTVATRGWNTNKHAYTEESLDSMARGLAGKRIHKAVTDLGPNEGTLVTEAGIVAESRRDDCGAVQVRVRWFSGKRPREAGYLTPSGMGVAEDKGNGYLWIHNYTPDLLAFNKDSAFRHATLI